MGILEMDFERILGVTFFITVRPWDARFLGNEKTRAAQIRATFVT